MSYDKIYMHTEDAYIKVTDMLDRYRGMIGMDKEEMESIQSDLLLALQELAKMVDDGK